ncbi:MAG TPA: S41 family peptidase [Cyclobacteriaceae bacterium]|nr:S41 family peptidase [Cyclobacteriaceae bacterium]
MRRIKWIVSIVVIAASAFAFTHTERYFEIAKSLDIFATLFKEVNAYYVDDVDPQKLIRKSIDSMLESLDPYTDYIPEDELENFKVITTGQYAGIGALIGVINHKTIITHPYKNFPAFKAGVKVGDEIVAVDGKNVQGKSTSEVSALLKGPSRTEVELKLRRAGKPGDFIVKIKREKITISNLAYAGLIGSDVAYIKLDDFTPGAAKEVSDALSKLKDQGAKKLILDLRDNPGGLMHEAINIVNLFIPRDQEVVSTKGKVPEWNKTYNTLNNPLDTTIPIAVLTGEGSASASEIVSGALQDYDRAVLVGRKTFGKGLVQTTRQLSYNSQLKVTTAKYYIPSGRCIQALDYAHRNEDGSVDKFPDSLRSEFKTKSGRKVYDGNGIDPDILIEDEYLGAVTVALIQNGLIFEYASKYCGEQPNSPDLKTFKLSDAEYNKFLEWVKAQKFSYATAIESSTNELIEAAKQERYYGELEAQLNDLKKKIETNKASDLVRFKKEISDILVQQIAFHYALAEGQATTSLSNDPTVIQAVKVLGDNAQYKSLLSPH